MTMIKSKKIECTCGQKVDFEYYDSVNINVNAGLKKEVAKRKINFFKCDKCGYEQELVAGFLYHDMKNKILVWVLPECTRGEKPTIDDTHRKIFNNLLKGLGEEEFIVYGYDELFKLLKNYESK